MYIHVHSINIYTGHPREILQGRTRLLWSFVDRLKLLSNLRICCPIKPLVNFHKSLSEFYMIIFLNKLKLVENTLIKINVYGQGYGALQRFTGPSLAVRALDRCTDWTLLSYALNIYMYLSLEDKFCYEKIHNKFCKYILGLKKIACNISAKSELVRFPITDYIKTQAILSVCRLAST